MASIVNRDCLELRPIMHGGQLIRISRRRKRATMTTIAMRRTTAPIALPLWLLFAWLSTAPFNAAEAAPILDNGFGNSGVVRLNVAGESVVSPAAIVIPQGGQLTVVATTSTIDSSQLVVQQYLPTGAIDGNFGVGGRVALPESLHCMARPGAIVPS